MPNAVTSHNYLEPMDIGELINDGPGLPLSTQFESGKYKRDAIAYADGSAN
jgi:hypothetical protein